MSSSSSSVIAKGLLYIWVFSGVENSRSDASPEACPLIAAGGTPRGVRS